MPQHSSRKFGEVPHQHQTGPITAKNYNYRAEKHCADKSAERKGQHPTISLNSPEFPLWRDYFDSLPGGRPYPFKLLIEGQILEMTVPEPIPQWFDRTHSTASQQTISALLKNAGSD